MTRSVLAALILAATAGTAAAAATGPGAEKTAAARGAEPIDLPTALRLAGAQNLEIQIAREQLNAARAQSRVAMEQFFPWLSAGIRYHRRDGLAQAVPAGTISQANFDSYSPGGGLEAEVDLGKAIFESLAAKQRAAASDHALKAQHHDSVLRAAQGYFDLLRAKALVGVAREAVATSRDYERQLGFAVASGIAFKGDELRVKTQTERYEIDARRALGEQRIAAAQLAETLRLDPTIELDPRDSDLAPLALFETSVSVESLVDRALRSRPERGESRALISAARDEKNGAVYGGLIPSLGAQVFAGGLGGGADGGPQEFGGTQDYLVGSTWRFGPGGLFDLPRIDLSKARLAGAELADERLEQQIRREVVEELTRIQTTSDQLELAKQNLSTANETLRLTRERKQFGVGIVLEDIQAQQALTLARAAYVAALVDFDKAQYGLNKAIGGTPEPEPGAPAAGP